MYIYTQKIYTSKTVNKNSVKCEDQWVQVGSLVTYIKY